MQVLSFSEALAAVQQYSSGLSPTEPELVSLLDGMRLALAEDLVADRDFPPFPRSTRDGYAVRAEDVADVPAQLRCIGELKAGASEAHSSITVTPGEAVEIMTGAPVPSGADAVLMVEYTENKGDSVTVKRTVARGENVVAAASEARQGDVMVARGTRVNHVTVAIAAAVGRADVAVYRRPRVAVLATGDELVDINFVPGANEIRNSNSYSLAAQINDAGGDAVILPIARDDAAELEVLIRKGAECDLLLLSGGVSMGKYDLVEQALATLGAQFFFTGVLIQPGKPLVFGELRGANKATPFFGLPGNPVSTMVTFQLFVRPVLDALAGARPQAPQFAQARLRSDFKIKPGLTRFLPGRLEGTPEQPEAELLKWQGSGDLMALAQANCYIVVPPDKEQFRRGRKHYGSFVLMAKKDKAPKKLSHYDAAGRASMVDVSAKSPTLREAEARAFVAMSKEVLRALPQNPKGDPLEVARIAGIQAAKRTSELIPMCHPIPLSKIDVSCEVTQRGIIVRSLARTTSVTGVEMEALVAASVAALTVYDMCKALDKGIEIREVVLERKSGGKSGDYRRKKS